MNIWYVSFFIQEELQKILNEKTAISGGGHK